MHRISSILLALALACSAGPSATDGNDDEDDDDNDAGGSDTSGESEADEGEDSGGTGTSGPESCRELHPPGETPEGEPCTMDTDCASLVCSHRDRMSAMDDATCLEPPAECNTRVRGTVRDVVSLLALPNITVAAVGAADAASDPAMAMAFATATSDSRGWFDVESESPITAPYALLGRSEAAGFARSLTPLDTPDSNDDYPAVLAVRDWWVITTSDLAQWNESFAGVPEAQPYLPLETGAAVFGIVRTAETPSTPIPNATVTPQISEGSVAQVFYLLANGNAFSGTSTSSNGIFLILGAAAGETFDVAASGRMTHAARVAGFSQAVFITDARLLVQ